MSKKIFLILLILILIIVIMLCDVNDSKEMRVRVIANSNSYIDQQLKMKIVGKLQNENLELKDLNIIKQKVEYIIKENNYHYTVNVEIKNQEFPTKYYENRIIAGGKYQTLVITLGKGEGNNYWSILYPEYYGIGFEEVNSGNVKYKVWLFDKIKEWTGKNENN